MLSYFTQLKSHHQLIFAVIIAFAVVAFWRGIWGLLDYVGAILFPGEEMFLVDSLLSVALGLAILISTHYAIKVLI